MYAADAKISTNIEDRVYNMYKLIFPNNTRIYSIFSPYPVVN